MRALTIRTIHVAFLIGVFAASIGTGFHLGQAVFQPPAQAAAMSPADVSPAPAPDSWRSDLPAAASAEATGVPSDWSPSVDWIPSLSGESPSGSRPSLPPPFGRVEPVVPPAPSPADAGRAAAIEVSYSPPAIPTSPAGASVSGEHATRYHVQAGAFKLWQEAEALALRLQSLGYSVKVVSGDSLYRVWVGGASLDEATAGRLAQNLREAGLGATLSR